MSYLRNGLSLDSVLCDTLRVCTPACLCHLCSILLRILMKILRNHRQKHIYYNMQSQFLGACFIFFLKKCSQCSVYHSLPFLLEQHIQYWQFSKIPAYLGSRVTCLIAWILASQNSFHTLSWTSSHLWLSSFWLANEEIRCSCSLRNTQGYQTSCIKSKHTIWFPYTE